jgi:hypothetical protein
MASSTLCMGDSVVGRASLLSGSILDGPALVSLPVVLRITVVVVDGSAGSNCGTDMMMMNGVCR